MTPRLRHLAFLIPTLLLPISSVAGSSSYRNPILRNVADPFVLKHRGRSYLYRTEVRGALDVQVSEDLVHWKPGPVVWTPETTDGPNSRLLWAPEVYHENGTFFLFFAASGPEGEQRLWRAVASSPLGPFRTDRSGPLTEPWRIDVSLFRDDDGWYLYCCHRLTMPFGPGGARVEGRRLGPGLTLPASPSGLLLGDWLTMVEPLAPWEGIWVEGPTVLKDRSGYYLLYSAPDAESPNYEVGYATAANPLGPWRKRGLLIPNVPGVPGPGHQCVVLGPDNLTPYLLYHRKRLAERGWDRDLMLDRLQMGRGRLTTRAPTSGPQPLPPQPAFSTHFADGEVFRDWQRRGGDWGVISQFHEMQQRDARATGRARLTRHRITDGVVEVNLRRLAGEGGIGIALVQGTTRLPVVLLPRGERSLQVGSSVVRLPEAVAPGVDHQLLLVRRGRNVRVELDGRQLAEEMLVAGDAALELVTERAAAAFSGIAITPYTEALPLGPGAPAQPVWFDNGGRIEQRYLGPQRQRYRLTQKLPPSGAFSVTVQGWALGPSLGVRKYGVELEVESGADRFEAYIDPPNQVVATHGQVAGHELPWQNTDLPLGFDYTQPHTLRLERHGARWRVTVDGGSTQVRSASLRGLLQAALVTEDTRCVFSGIRIERRTSEGPPGRRRA